MRLPALRRGSYANVASTLALVIAVSSGSAYAATIITSKQIKNGTIQTVDLHANAVTGAKVKDKSLTKADLANGTIPGLAARAKSNANPVALNAAPTTVAQLSIPQAGHYLVSAVTTINNLSDTETSATCYLNGSGDSDSKLVYVQKLGANSPSRAVISLQLANSLPTAGNFTLSCISLGGLTVNAVHTQISALKVDALTIED